MRPDRPLLLLVIFALSACVPQSVRPVASADAPPFSPIAFFSGRTEGDGRLKVIMSNPRTVHITGNGTLGADGGLVLVQRIEQEGRKTRTRRWTLHATGPFTYDGALSDAVGPVQAEAVGGLLHIRFKTKGNLAIEQWLALEPGGRAARNHLVVRKFGMRVAVLDETIRKVD